MLVCVSNIYVKVWGVYTNLFFDNIKLEKQRNCYGFYKGYFLRGFYETLLFSPKLPKVSEIFILGI